MRCVHNALNALLARGAVEDMAEYSQQQRNDSIYGELFRTIHCCRISPNNEICLFAEPAERRTKLTGSQSSLDVQMQPQGRVTRELGPAQLLIRRCCTALHGGTASAAHKAYVQTSVAA